MARDAFPDVPIEVCCWIVELAAESDVQDAVRWLRVSRGVASCVEPVLYHTLRVTPRAPLEAIVEALQRVETRRPGFGAMYVRNLCLPTPEGDYTSLFAVCPRIENLFYGGALADIESTLCPNALYLPNLTDVHFDFRAGLYERLTRLDVGDIVHNTAIAMHVHLLTRLTHLALAVPDRPGTPAVGAALVGRALEVLGCLRAVRVELYDSRFAPVEGGLGGVWGVFAGFVGDGRVVVVPGPGVDLGMMYVEWERLARLGLTKWDDM